jgi:hypothetical protein
MYKVRLNWRQLSVLAQIAKAKQVVTDMTGNPNYATPFPALASITTAADEMEIARKAEEEGGLGTKAVLKAKAAVLKNLMDALAGYIDFESGGDQAKIESTGLEARATHTSPLPPPDAPYGLKVIPSLTASELLIRFKENPKALFYTVVKTAPSQDGNVNTENWINVGLTSKLNIVAHDLTPGAYYGFKVKATARSGESAWSETVVAKVIY